jgi:hypothetical protein
MRFAMPTEPVALARYLPEFMALTGTGRWIERADQLADEMRRSPYLHRIVLDYHSLELMSATSGRSLHRKIAWICSRSLNSTWQH